MDIDGTVWGAIGAALGLIGPKVWEWLALKYKSRDAEQTSVREEKWKLLEICREDLKEARRREDEWRERYFAARGGDRGSDTG